MAEALRQPLRLLSLKERVVAAGPLFGRMFLQGSIFFLNYTMQRQQPPDMLLSHILLRDMVDLVPKLSLLYARGRGLMRSVEPSNPCPLLRLSTELLQDISDYLYTRDALNFQASCRTLYAAIQRPKYTELVLKEISQPKGRPRTHLACASCRRYLLATAFQRKDRGCYEYWIVEQGVGHFERKCVVCYGQRDVRQAPHLEYTQSGCIVDQWVFDIWRGFAMKGEEFWPSDHEKFSDICIGDFLIGLCASCGKIAPKREPLDIATLQVLTQQVSEREAEELVQNLDSCLLCL
ncbi:hypothetical protein B0O99DRAFT_618562 [Bisporella sp. PMI_857]|nr:hypothetical protein B0O99DRAFT_618562 [Bisporella sp. PMI_857]